MGKLNVHLMIIDPQVDFMDLPGSSLPVPGAAADMDRLATMVDRVSDKVDDVHVTVDSHHLIDIAHTGATLDGISTPSWWMDQNGNNPPPYQVITAADVKNGIWIPRRMALRSRTIDYLDKLAASPNQYPLIAWPPHCLIGTKGHNIYEPLMKALLRWCARQFAIIDFVTKGSNIFVEHYGGMKAEVEDPDDPTTALNMDFIKMIQDADIIACAGEALSHCFRSTMQQIIDNIGPEHLKKFHILTDATSPVPAAPGLDFPAISKAWLADIEKMGVTLTTTDKFLV